MKTYRVAALCGLIALAAPLRAQTCLGHIPFSKAPMRVDATFESEDGQKAYGASLAFGSKSGVFGIADFALQETEGFDNKAKMISGTLGYSWAPKAYPAIAICPLIGAGYGWIDETVTGSEVKMTATNVNFGGAIGMVMSESEGFSFVPTLRALAIIPDATAKVNGTKVDTGPNDKYGLLSLGAGLHFNDAVTVLPAVHFPVSLDGGKTSYSLTIGFGFGGKGHK